MVMESVRLQLCVGVQQNGPLCLALASLEPR